MREKVYEQTFLGFLIDIYVMSSKSLQKQNSTQSWNGIIVQNGFLHELHRLYRITDPWNWSKFIIRNDEMFISYSCMLIKYLCHDKIDVFFIS